MRGVTPSLPQHVFMAWCLVKHRVFSEINAPLLWISHTRFVLLAAGKELVTLTVMQGLAN
jgi:hypothetical protein